MELAQRASRQFTGKKKATKAPKTKAVAPKKAVAVAAAAGKDVTGALPSDFVSILTDTAHFLSSVRS